MGDVVLLGTNAPCGSEPEGHITVTAIYLATEYALDQLFLQYAAILSDRLTAQGFADALYSEPAISHDRWLRDRWGENQPHFT